MRNNIVVDLDGTLADLSHRLPLIKGDKKQWDEFYSLVGRDSVNIWCSTLMRAMRREGFNVVVVSARPMTVFDATHDWLNRGGVQYGNLYLLRKDEKDHTPDVELKRNWLKAYGKENILFAVDDRQRVVDMWREEGVTCLQCNAWKEDKPNTKDLPLAELAKTRGYKADVNSVSVWHGQYSPLMTNVTFVSPNAEQKARKYLLRKPHVK